MINREYQSTNFVTGLRGFAVLMIFLIHSGGGGLREMFHFGDRIVDMGKYGVDIFFVISGFTIFHQFYKKNYTFKDFLIIRILRVSIPYFPILIILYILNLLGVESINYWTLKFNNGEIDFLNICTHIFYISYIDIKYANSIIGVEWTLAIEVFYYLLLGLIISNLNHLLKVKINILYAISFFIIGVLMTYIGKVTNSQLFISWLPFKYGYMFLIGGLAYHLREVLNDNINILKRYYLSNVIIFICIILFIIFMINDNRFNIGIINELFFTFITFMLIIFINDDSQLSIIFTNKIIRFIGSISFSFYLLHIIILKLEFLQLNIDNKQIDFLYLLSLISLLSFIYYWLLEVKVYKKIKNKIKRGKRID